MKMVWINKDYTRLLIKSKVKVGSVKTIEKYDGMGLDFPEEEYSYNDILIFVDLNEVRSIWQNNTDEEDESTFTITFKDGSSDTIVGDHKELYTFISEGIIDRFDNQLKELVL